MTFTSELRALTIVTTATSLMWVPYVCARFWARGLKAIANVDPGVPPEPQWALRARRAHANAIENLVVFAPLVLIAACIGISTPVTTDAARIFVISRLAHYVVFTTGVPFLRTIAFLSGSVATLVMAAVLLQAAFAS